MHGARKWALAGLVSSLFLVVPAAAISAGPVISSSLGATTLGFIVTATFLVSFSALLVAAGLTLFYMFRASQHLGVVFAVGHLLFALFLLPLFLLGLFVAPYSVETEVLRRAATHAAA